MDPLDLLAGWELIDISRPLVAGIPVWPGDPPFACEVVASVPADGYALTRLHLTTHTATHVDPPAHMLAGGATLDAFPLTRWVGRCRVVDIPPAADLVTAAHLEAARAFYEKHGGKEKATWLNVVAWGNLGDVCAEYLDKGRSVFVEGRIDVRTIESNDGQRRTFTDIVAHNVQFLSPSKQQQRTSDAENTFGPPPTFGAMDEDVPF